MHWLKEDFRLCAIEMFNKNGTCVLRKGKFGNSNQTSTELNDGERILGFVLILCLWDTRISKMFALIFNLELPSADQIEISVRINEIYKL